MAELLTNEQAGEKDDFTLDAVPVEKRMPWLSILNVTLGITGAMIFMQVAGQMALAYGSRNAIIAMVYATVINGILATIFAFFAAKTGLNSNLMARGAGYGFVGAALTSLIYASNFIVLAAIEGSIMSHAIHAYIPSLPIWLIMVILGIGIIPLNWYGMKQLNKFQKYSLPIYLILLVSGIIFALNMKVAPAATNWITFLPEGQATGGLALLTCMGVYNGIIGLQSLLTADYARYLKPKEIKFGSLLIGFLPQIGSYFIMGMVGIWFALRFAESNPGVYMVTVLGIGGAAYTVLSQLRINLINLYSGSLSLANFFSRIFHFTPGRVFWVVVTAMVALIAMLSNIIDHIGAILTFQGVSMFAWTASMVADLLIVKKVLKIGPSQIEYRRGFLRDWNPVGPIALLLGSVVGSYFAIFQQGTISAAISAFIAAGISFVVHIILAVATKGKYYDVPSPHQEPIEPTTTHI
ncbi:purine-cytosine permease family protein [Bacillus tuaregi]|uniref:purine-cytosine permease family protein n=1 Tax=Bacillus tuaregi TaxID=1816695 RepID=UPI0008F950D3|nr:permease [Bacillus tuaregi]